MFNQECREKKRIGSNISKRASRLGFVRGGIKTQYDFLTAKERKNLNGEVRVRFMYSEIGSVPKLDDIKRMDESKAKNTLSMVKHNFTCKQLTEHWGISSGKMYGVFEKYGVHQKKEENRRPRGVKKDNKVDEAIIETTVETKEENKDHNELKDVILELQKTIECMRNEKVESKNFTQSGFKVEFAGEYNKEEVENRLLSISGVMVEGKQYKVQIVLEEV